MFIVGRHSDGLSQVQVIGIFIAIGLGSLLMLTAIVASTIYRCGCWPAIKGSVEVNVYHIELIGLK